MILAQTELHMYGSSRIGIYNVNIDVTNTAIISPTTIFTRGNKFFELSNHLGNVLVTVSDKKLQYSSNTTSIDYYKADVVTASDYYPFGMQMPGRKYTQPNSSYRYGFNGQENSDEIAAGLTTALYWEYDSRIGRRWNVEPEIKKYADFSSYLCFRNSPILYSDPDGKDVILLTWATKSHDPGHTAIAIQDYIQVKERVNGKVVSIMKPTNTYTIYEFGPASPLLSVDQANANVTSASPVYSGITKKQLIALFGSTYTDHPTDWYVMPYNRALAANYLYWPSRLSYDNKDYDETKNSQSDELVSSVAIHGMRTWWEDITPEQAVNRALYGGTFKERDGTVIK